MIPGSRMRALLVQALARQLNVQPPVLANVAFASGEYRAGSRLPPFARFHSPLDGVKQLLLASISFIVGLLTEVLLHRLPARDNRLREDRVFIRQTAPDIRIPRAGQRRCAGLGCRAGQEGERRAPVLRTAVQLKGDETVDAITGTKLHPANCRRQLARRQTPLPLEEAAPGPVPVRSESRPVLAATPSHAIPAAAAPRGTKPAAKPPALHGCSVAS